MFAGVVFVASYTAQLTTALTVEQIRGAIQGPDDLPGKRVGTIAQTLAVDYLREHRAQVQEFPTIDYLSKALIDKKVDAAFTAAPLLRYYAAHEGKGQVKLVGPEINIAPASIMVQLNSPLRKSIDGALLTLREDGTYQKLYEKWFGVALNESRREQQSSCRDCPVPRSWRQQQAGKNATDGPADRVSTPEQGRRRTPLRTREHLY